MYKRILLSMLLVAGAITFNAEAQTDLSSSFTPQDRSQAEFMPGEVLVRFEDDRNISIQRPDGQMHTTGIGTVDLILGSYDIDEMERLLPQAEPVTDIKRMKSYSGQDVEVPSLHNIYRVRMREPERMHELIRELESDSSVRYAEPNYIYAIDGRPTDSEESLPSGFDSADSGSEVVVPNDPMYDELHHIQAIRADEVWSITTGDTNAVIAILDTGVDWKHPDLSDNIWINHAEKHGIDGRDDDGNGFVDDIRGWDFVNNNNDPMDDNSHGTHVAGIAAAVGNNEKGITGVNWNARIMPVKVLQSSGRGDAATIIKGIWYAYENGATVINMSFGGYGRSLTMEDALAVAYSQAVLVAAAGNDGLCIGQETVLPLCPDGRIGEPFFPAALSYVIGVEAGDSIGPEGFSNYDQYGPVNSGFSQLWNYELRAPGANLLSTIPNGSYRTMSGTSMAAPVIAGAVSLYQNLNPGDSQEILWGNLINSSEQVIDLVSSLEIDPYPVLSYVSHTIVDTLDGDGDGRVDAGETIELWFTLRNTWGRADSVWIELQFGEFEDENTAIVLKDSAFFGSVSEYATVSNESDPILIKFADDLVNNRDIEFKYSVYADGELMFGGVINFTIYNLTQIGGVITGEKVLTPDQEYLVVENLFVDKNAHLTILPGTTLNFLNGKGITIVGRFNIIGEPENRIHIRGLNKQSGSIIIYSDYSENTASFLQYATIEGFDIIWIRANHDFNGTIYFSNNIIREIYSQLLIVGTFLGNINAIVKGNLFYHNEYTGNLSLYSQNDVVSDNVFMHNSSFYSHGIRLGGVFSEGFHSNTFINNKPFDIALEHGIDSKYIINNYWGYTDSTKISPKIFDFFQDSGRQPAIYWPYLTKPSTQAPGHIWKVLVNGQNPKEGITEPIGPGRHRFDVYFNRPMDIKQPPFLSFGVRDPYTQHVVQEDASWSADSTIWTAFYDIGYLTGDGINRIRVSGARDDNYTEIPVEYTRFEFDIQAVRAASDGFESIAGLGKVDLNWEVPDLPDVLGYNMYRFKQETDTTFSDTLQVNSEVLLDTLYIDFDVEPGKRYFYQYRVLRTSLEETDPSRVVSSIPLTAEPGDANGDFKVDVVDVVTTVSYILGQNPQPFIFEAADINQDGVVDVLDVVAIINIILSDDTKAQFVSSGEAGEALLSFDQNIVELNTIEPVTGLQFTFTGWKDHYEWEVLPALSSFEVSHNIRGDSLKVIAYNLQGNSLALGSSDLIQIDGDSVYIAEVVLSDHLGQSVFPEYEADLKEAVPENMELGANYPNPFNNQTTITFGINEQVTGAELIIYDVLGRRIQRIPLGELSPGHHELTWDATRLASGVYLYQLRVDQEGRSRIIDTRKMMLLK